ncbi:MAG: ABC transporter ATP-binding protein [Bacteroidales bacterium]|nr:ABC transporter ATP-binding protein [Bacteroidales bacterium]
MNNLIEIKDLSIGFEREGSWNKVVKNISFSIDKGEILGLVGESGSGKSVSSLAIMGLLPERKSKILSGSILFNNIDLCNITNKEHRKLRGKKIAMIFQEPMTALNPVVRCGNQVMEMIIHNNSISKREAKKRVLELFKEVKLPDIERAFRAYPHELSGGQKQRVMIAMAISCNPDLLIADEPTTALDVTVQKTILELLKSIQNKYNIGILFITHDLGVIKQIANRVAVLYKGEIVEQGLVQDIFYKPNHPYTQGLIACRPPIENRPKRLLTVSDFLKEEKKDIEILTEKERDLIHKEIYSQEPILKINSLDIEFITKKTIFGKIRKSVKAVNNVSFDVFKGETLGLVGESGCGKTTVGRGILNLIDAKSGKVELFGVNLLELSKNKMREYRKKIQIIFQDPYSSLNSKITIGHAIQEPMIVHSLYENNEKRKERVMDLLEKVGLERSHYNRYPHEFSGGQRQRIGIARALALEPEIIICDESVSALDVSVQAQVLNLINDLKRDFGFTCIFISHDLSVVKYMSDRIIVMQKGNIVEEAEADSIYNNPQTQYTRQLINSIPL